MYCTFCGNTLNAGDRYCARCGKANAPEGAPPAASFAHAAGGQRRLQRDMRNRKLGGVCAGFARYLDWDVTLIRIAFILTTVFYGTGLLVYIVCWLAMPKDDWSIPQHSPAAPPAS